MNIEEIANSIESSETLNQVYRKTRNRHPWIIDLLNKGYEKMSGEIKLHSNNSDYLSYQKAAFIMDEVVFTISAIYEKAIADLKKEQQNDSRTQPVTPNSNKFM